MNFNHRMRTSWVMVGAGAFLAAQMYSPPRCSADIYQRPGRPLTIEEQLGYSLGSADAVIIAQVSAITDSLEKAIGHAGYMNDHALTVRPISWLKGTGPHSRIKVGLTEDWDMDDNIKYKLSNSSVVALLFLRAVPRPLTPAHGRAPWPYPPSRRWQLLTNPFGYAGGFRELSVLNQDSVATAVRGMVAQQSLARLVQNADVIVLANILAQPAIECKADGLDEGCATVAVTRVLAGQVDAKQLTLVIPYGGVPIGDSILFLTRANGNTYRSCVYGTALFKVEGDEIPELGRSVKNLEAELRGGGQ